MALESRDPASKYIRALLQKIRNHHLNRDPWQISHRSGVMIPIIYITLENPPWNANKGWHIIIGGARYYYSSNLDENSMVILKKSSQFDSPERVNTHKISTKQQRETIIYWWTHDENSRNAARHVRANTAIYDQVSTSSFSRNLRQIPHRKCSAQPTVASNFFWIVAQSLCKAVVSELIGSHCRPRGACEREQSRVQMYAPRPCCELSNLLFRYLFGTSIATALFCLMALISCDEQRLSGSPPNYPHVAILRPFHLHCEELIFDAQ